MSSSCNGNKKRQGQDTMKTADDIILLGEMLVRRYRLDPETDSPIPVKVDDGGVGGGVVDRLKQIKRNDPERPLFFMASLLSTLILLASVNEYFRPESCATRSSSSGSISSTGFRSPVSSSFCLPVKPPKKRGGKKNG